MRKALESFNHFFVQNEISKELLNKININTVTVSGDTRFDRVSQQLEQDNHLDFVTQFKQDSLCIVCGSTWPDDEVALLDYINSVSGNVKFIIAPHKIERSKIEAFQRSIQKNVALFSEKDSKNLSEFSVLIIDSIGLLTKIYSYADIAYVGGAMGNTGLHNILEPATFGVPIIIGQNFKKFPEAKKLQNLGGLFSISNSTDCSQILNSLVSDEDLRIKSGMISKHYINSNTGATKKAIDYIDKLQINTISDF